MPAYDGRLLRLTPDPGVAAWMSGSKKLVTIADYTTMLRAPTTTPMQADLLQLTYHGCLKPAELLQLNGYSAVRLPNGGLALNVGRTVPVDQATIDFYKNVWERGWAEYLPCPTKEVLDVLRAQPLFKRTTTYVHCQLNQMAIDSLGRKVTPRSIIALRLLTDLDNGATEEQLRQLYGVVKRHFLPFLDKVKEARMRLDLGMA